MPTSASGGAIDADGSAFLTGGTDGKLVLVKVTATGQYEASYVGDFSETAAAGSGGSDAFVTPAGILVAGWTNDENGQRQVLLVRFTAALALDPTFGGGTGFARLQIADPHTPAHESVGSAVTVGPANEIYVAGRASDAAGMAIMRFSSSGIPDGAFGSDGIRRVQTARAGGVSLAEDIVVQPDGRVLVVGTSSDTVGVVETAILRLDIHGDLDPTFGSGGIVRLTGAATAHAGAATAVAITADGTALTVAGAASTRPVVSPGFVARVLLTTRCDLPSPSLVGARCRVSLLEEIVMSSVPAGKLKHRLTAALGRTAALLEMASNTSGHAFRRKLRKARVSARRVRHRLNSTAAKRSIPAEVRASLVTEAGPIPREIHALIKP
jgi:uncharacterized delta-60 repeat protein